LYPAAQRGYNERFVATGQLAESHRNRIKHIIRSGPCFLQTAGNSFCASRCFIDHHAAVHNEGDAAARSGGTCGEGENGDVDDRRLPTRGRKPH
jgi:hypothetical protein